MSILQSFSDFILQKIVTITIVHEKYPINNHQRILRFHQVFKNILCRTKSFVKYKTLSGEW